jgi:hypothetical protein
MYMVAHENVVIEFETIFVFVLQKYFDVSSIIRLFSENFVTVIPSGKNMIDICFGSCSCYARHDENISDERSLVNK